MENNWWLPNPAGISTQEEEDKPEEDSATPAIDKSARIATLPKTPEEKQKLLKEIEEATSSHHENNYSPSFVPEIALGVPPRYASGSGYPLHSYPSRAYKTGNRDFAPQKIPSRVG